MVISTPLSGHCSASGSFIQGKITLISGRTGSGKSSFIADMLKKLPTVGFPGSLTERVYVIVPDQYTMAAEKFYIGAVGEDKLKNVRILSFKRFCSLVFDHLGGFAFEFIGDGGRRALVSKALSEVSLFFRHYPPSYYSMTFVDLLCDMIRELKACGIKPDELLETAKASRNLKLEDISLVYNGFEVLLNGGFFDPDDNWERLSASLHENTLFSGTDIFIDNFKTFNSKEFRIIKDLAGQGANIYVSLPCEGVSVSDKWDVLSRIEAQAGKLAALAKKTGCHFEVINTGEPKRFKSKELAFAEKYIFSREKHSEFDFFRSNSGCESSAYGEENIRSSDAENKTSVSFPENEKTDDIVIYKGADIFDEIDFAASEITRLVRDCGYKYSDFVIASRDMDKYCGFLEPVFYEYGIPVFLHKKTPLSQKPPVLLLSSLLSIVTDGYEPDNVTSCLKTGFFRASSGGIISGEDVSLFCSYVNRWKLHGGAYLKPFTIGINGFDLSENDEAIIGLEKINTVRKLFTDFIEKFKKQCRNSSVKKISEALYEFFCDIGIEKSLEDMADFYKSYGEQALYEEQLQVYGLILKAVDELVMTCGDDIIAVPRYRDLIMSVIEGSDISIIPTSLDQVMTGNIDKLPLMSPEGVFVIGLNDGSFPKTSGEDSLLSDEDKKTLAENDIEIGMTGEEKLMFERFLFYSAVSAPRKKLYLSYGRGGEAGSQPSVFISEIQKLFGGRISVIQSPLENGYDGLMERLQSENSAFSLYSKIPDALPSLKDYFENTGYSLFFSTSGAETEALSPGTGKKLFGKDMFLSYSKVDRYYKCPFSFFMQYGIGVREKRNSRLDSLEIGNFLHAALENLLPEALSEAEESGIDALEKLSETKSDLNDCSVGLSSSMKAKIAVFGKEYIDRIFGGQEPPASFSRYFDQLMKKVERLILTFIKEQAQSEFVPSAYELEIRPGKGAEPIRISVDDGFVSLIGTVDRLDRFEKDGKTYIRIIDYKTGRKDFDLQKIYHGIDVQLIMYLYSVLLNSPPGKEFVPAGTMYVNINPTIVTVGRGEGAKEAEKKLEKEKKRSGLFIDDPEVLNAMDYGLSGKYVPVTEKTWSKTVAKAEDFGLLFEHIKNLLEKMGRSLHGGFVKKDPFADDKAESCKYCSYAPYCAGAALSGAKKMDQISRDNIFGVLDDKNNSEK